MRRHKYIRLGIGAFVCMVIVSFTPAHAEELSTGQVYAFCISKDEVARTACRFFILGAVLGINLGDGAVMGSDKQYRERSRTHFCIPDDIENSTMVSVFQNMVDLDVKKYPEDLKLPAISFVDAAMNRAYPCTKTN
jgi:Rap1a immunity proteins